MRNDATSVQTQTLFELVPSADGVTKVREFSADLDIIAFMARLGDFGSQSINICGSSIRCTKSATFAVDCAQ